MTRTTLPPRFSVPALFPQLAGMARETVRLHPRIGPEPAIDASKLGGSLLWPVQSAAGLMIGDMGALYVFICRICDGWPIATISQSS